MLVCIEGREEEEEAIATIFVYINRAVYTSCSHNLFTIRYLGFMVLNSCCCSGKSRVGGGINAGTRNATALALTERGLICLTGLVTRIFTWARSSRWRVLSKSNTVEGLLH